MSAHDDLAARIYELERLVATLGRTSQLSSSTIGTSDAGDGPLVSDIIAEAAASNDAVPDLQDDAADSTEASSDLQAELQANHEDLAARFEGSAVDLQLAQEQLDDAQQKLDDAFIDIGDLGSANQANAEAARAASAAAADAATAATNASQAASAAQSTADTAKTNASTANQAALDAAGLAASKGEVIRQVSAPTGSRANPANLWINTTPDANGNPRNTPNLYNTTTGKWEPVTDQKVIDAANAASAAASAAAAAQSTADAAKSSAQTAQTAASAAQSTADQAQQTAGTAASNAQAAIVSAAAAQTAADDAKAAAQVAAAKAVAIAAGVLDNGSAEFDFDSWDASAKGSIVVQASRVRSGKKAWQAGANGEIRQGEFPVKPGDTWRFRFWHWTTGTGTPNGGLRLQGIDKTASSPAWGDRGTANVSVVSGWTMQEVSYTVPATGTTHLRARIAFSNPSTITVAFDDIDLVNVTDAKAAADAAALAQSTADTAKANAAAAASSAATAQQAADAAQATANTAKTNAATAQTAADNANSQALAAAGIANGKGRVIYQATAPTGANANATNLWIRSSDNIPFTYDATNAKWVQATDKTAVDAAAAAASANTAAGNAKTAADNAATAASNAQQTANQAQSAAASAQATATGKPQILFGTGTPAGTAPYGSTWFQVDASGSVMGQWQQTASSNTGSTWTARQLRSEVIANLDVGKLTAGTANIVDAVIQKIAAQTANIQTANIKNLFVTAGATMSQATIDALWTQVVNAYKITATMIDVGSLNGVTLTGTTVQTAASGKRAVLGGALMRFYDSNNAQSGQIEGYANGAAGGIVRISPDGFDSAATFFGTQALPSSGSATMRTPVVWADRVVAASFEDASGRPLLSDTGWINLATQNGWRNQSGTVMRYRVRNNTVYLQGYLSKTNATTTVFATLPSNLTPNQTIRLPATNGTGSNGTWMDIPISPDGTLAANTARDPNFAVSWPLDQ